MKNLEFNSVLIGNRYRKEFSLPDYLRENGKFSREKTLSEIVREEYGEIDEEAFRNFYVTVLSVTRDGIADEPNGDDETVLKIVYGIRGGKKMTLEFIRVAERKCVMKVDGEGRFFVYRTKVDKIVEDMLTLLGK